MIHLRHARVEFTPAGCLTTFADGTSWGALPHDTESYRRVATRTGYGSIMAYCRQHDTIHHLVAEHIGDEPCPVLWALAHGREPDHALAARTEALVQMAQRFIQVGDDEPILIAGIDWHGIRSHAREVLGREACLTHEGA